MVLPPSASVC
jgi:hypothetical protein